jgi:hypothetical protein
VREGERQASCCFFFFTQRTIFYRRFWEVFERKGVEPVYHEKAQAVYYAQQRGRLGIPAVRIYDEAGNVEREIMPADEDRMLYRGNRASSF